MKYLRIPLIVIATVFLTIFASASFGDHQNPGLEGVPFIGATTINLNDGTPVLCQKPAYGMDGKENVEEGAVGDADVVWYCVTGTNPVRMLYCLPIQTVMTPRGPAEMWGCDPDYHRAWQTFTNKYGVEPNNPVDRGMPV